MDEKYFIRVRGRVTGPYPVDDLRNMADLGTLTSVYDISADGKTWRPVDSMPELFETVVPPKPPPISSAAVEPAPVPLAPFDGQPNTVAPPPPPVTRPTAVPASDSVPWARPATSVGEPKNVSFAEESPAPTEGARTNWRRQLRQVSLADGVCVGIVLLICANIPHTRMAGSLVWWWDFWAIDGGKALFVLYLLAMAIAVAIVFVAPITRDQARGWAYLLIGGLCTCLLVAAAAVDPFGSGHMASAVFVPIFAATLMGVSMFRARFPDAPTAGAVQMVVAVPLAVATLAAGVFVMIGLVQRVAAHEGAAWPIFTIILMSLTILAGLTGAILGMVGARSVFSRRLHRAVVITSILAVSLLAISATVAGFGLATTAGGDAPGGRFVLVQTLRLLVAAYSLAAMLGIGLCEILSHKQLSPPPLPNPAGPAYGSA